MFSTDKLAGQGISQIKNYDFASIIKASNEMDGFKTPKKGPTLKLGYNIDTIYEKLDTVIEKLNNNEFKNLYIIGLLNYGYETDDFFERLYKKIGEDNFIISLAYEKKADNIFHIKSFFDFSLIYKIINKIKSKLTTEKTGIKMILTQCTNATMINFFHHFLLHYLNTRID